MASNYENPISIRDAIECINNNDYLLPAIQRKFVWKSQQICVLFDSIMCGYPINTFMFWEIKADEIKKGYQFYEFLNSYCPRFGEENPHKKVTASFKDFNAIIDGQQRLTSLYIGLCGTYAYKPPRVHWPSAKDDNILQPRKLYLNLIKPNNNKDDDSLTFYEFKFLTQDQYEFSLKDPSTQNYWFCMHEVLNLPPHTKSTDILRKVVTPELKKRGLSGNDFAEDTLHRLYEAIRIDRIIHYFKETSQKIDNVLDIFIRTNSGGTKLDFADLLVSIAVAQWDGDFKKELDDLTKHIHQNQQMGFYIERDWVLKACLMLIDADVRFKVQNFNADQVKEIQKQWSEIKECVKATFLLIRRFGIIPQSLTSKNAVIPICYYLYKHKVGSQSLYLLINNPTKVENQRSKISQWFYMVLLKGIFGGQADAILTSMREVFKANIGNSDFPLEAIISRYTGNKNLRFDDETIESMLDIEHGEGHCRALLHLLYPEMDPSRVYHIDHLHPKSQFDKNNLKKHEFLSSNNELLSFYQDKKHWNSIANLHLLNDSQNTSKNDRSLCDWFDDPSVHISKNDLLVDEVNLEFENFKEFYLTRRANLKSRLISRVLVSKSISDESLVEEFDEEIVDDLLV